jgi:tetratricopeptide (TPR) repeat protein
MATLSFADCTLRQEKTLMNDSQVDVKTLLAWGQNQIEEKRYTAAALTFNTLYRATGEPNHLLQLAIIARRAGETQLSDSLFTSLLEKHGENYGYCMEAGFSKLDLSHHNEALSLFQRAYSLKETANAALWCGASLARSGACGCALKYFDRALSHEPDLLSAKIEKARCLENINRIGDAIEIYRDLISEATSPAVTTNLTYIYNRLGLCYDRTDNMGDLSRLLDDDKYWENLHADYAISRTIVWCIRLNKNIREDRIADAALGLPSQVQSREIIDALSLYVARNYPEVSEYVPFEPIFRASSYGEDALSVIRLHGVGAILRIADSVPFLKMEVAIDFVIDHIQSGQPFSLIRIGDGEGNFLGHHLFPDSEFLSGLNEKILQTWFGKNAKYSSEYRQLYCDLHNAMVNADLLGMPDGSRIKLELQHDPRGYWGVHFAVDYIQKKVKPTCAVSAGIHTTLFRSSRFVDALRSLNNLNTISCHQKFGRLFRAKMGVPDGHDLLVPGEMGIGALPTDCKIGDHYPTEYRKTVSAIQAANFGAGSVTLIGAGVCGKAYADYVKKSGGVAIDIGAMADFIMGLETRKMFRRNEFRAHYQHMDDRSDHSAN